MTQRTTVVAGPDVSRAVATLMSGEVFTALAVEEPERRAAALKSLLQTIVDSGTRVAWVGNPLRSPLTMERFLLQIGGSEIDLRIERGPAELAQVIAQRVGTESRLLVIVQQPETINPETLEQFAAMAGHFGQAAVQVQFLFVGSPALRLPEVERAEIRQLLLRPPAADASPPEVTQIGPRRRDVLPLILLLLCVTIGVVFSLAPPSQQPLLAAPVIPAQVAEIRPPVLETEILRGQFDKFLAARVTTLPPLTDAQKDALFTEFLTHHRRE